MNEIEEYHLNLKGTFNNSKFVTPAKTGVQPYREPLDSGFCRNDIFRGNLKRLNFNDIFLDRDKDGMVDTVDLQIHLSPTCGKSEILSAIFDLCASIGFEAMGINLPIVTDDTEIDPSFKHHLFIGLSNELKVISDNNLVSIWYLREKDEPSLVKSIRGFTLSLFLNSKTERRSRQTIKKFSKRRGFNLFNPFSNEGFYEAAMEDHLAFFFPYKILLFSHLEPQTAKEAANFAARLGLESLQISLPLAFSQSSKPTDKSPVIYIGKGEDLREIGLQRFSNFIHQWDSGIFLIPSRHRIPDLLICGDEGGLQKILRYLSTLPEDSKGPTDPIFSGIKKFAEGLKEFIFRRPSAPPSSQNIKVCRYSIDDERKEVITLLKRELAKVPPKKGLLEIEIFLTRPEKERRLFAEELRELIEKVGYEERRVHLTILNAYKPGLSWMREVVLREIAKEKPERVEIAFQPFREKGLEEPIRWLQEIYPIDEIFARKLSISKERIEFKQDSRIKEVYCVRAWRKGKMVYEAQFSPKWKKMNYLRLFPRLGKVHPCVGWLGVKIDGEKFLDQPIHTGIGQAWRIYQEEILPIIKKEADRVLSIKKILPKSCLFEELRFDVYLNYPMEELGVDEERISPLEALHEDLYFVTLDFFAHYLKMKKASHIYPGRILPFVHPNDSQKKGTLKFTLIQLPESNDGKERRVEISLNGIGLRGSDVMADLSIEIEGQENLKRVRKRIESYENLRSSGYRIESLNEERGSKARLNIITTGSSLIEMRPTQPKKVMRPQTIPMERSIGYAEGVSLIRSFEGLPGVHVIEEGRSSGGLPLYSLEHTYPCPSQFVSHRKRAWLKPTFFINCRHHANEISSTNAGLKLSYLLASQPDIQRLLKKVNVVINPMENVDGVIVLEEMLKETPRDKLHAGRYNRAGQEYYDEYFNPNTPFGEARVKQEIWNRWLPDICVDNHGFPSHEWDQPFSGYAPFRFREWWIPRAFYFFYLPFLEEGRRSRRRIRSEKFGKKICNFLIKDKIIVERNINFFKRYLTYRKEGKTPRYKMKSRMSFFPLQKRFQRTNYAYRYPQITGMDFITEVADEIVCGKSLKNCLSAHLQTNLAVINLLNSLHFLVMKKYQVDREGVHVTWYRERPLNFRK